MKRVTLLVLLGGLALARVADAQVLTTGNIIGTVKDESGAVLPGVTITLASPGRQTVTRVTTETGEYRFILLDAGSYTLTAMLDGFNKYTEEGLLVQVGGTTARDITLKVGAVTEAVIVTGESPMVDPRRFGVTENIKREVIDVLPTQHDRIMEFAKWAPGVSAGDLSGSDYDLAVMGSTDNTPLIDGAPQGGRGDPETVAEIQAITLGAPAEYQVAEGGVFVVVTKSGTNLFQLTASAFEWPDSLVSSPVQLPCPTCSSGVSGYHRPINHDYAAQFGGPIRRDRLFFYTAFNYFHREETQPGTDPNLLPRVARINHPITAKITWKINDKATFKGGFYNAIWARPGGPGISTATGTGATIVAPPSTILSTGGNIYDTYQNELDYVLSPNTLLTVLNTGIDRWHEYNKPLSGDYTTPIHTDVGTGISCCGVSSFSLADIYIWQESAKLNRYIQTAHATHDLGFGVQFEQQMTWTATARPSGVNYTDFNGQPDQATFQGPSVSGGLTHNQGVWAQDQINLSRLTVNLGARFDRLHGISQDMPVFDNLLQPTGATIKGLGDMITWNAWAPRLGGNLRLTDDGKLTVRFSAGRSYRDISPGDFSLVSPGIASSTLAAWVPATNSYSKIISVTNTAANLRFDPNMKLQHTDSYSIGIDRELRPSLAVGATYVYKNAADFSGWTNDGVYGTQTMVLPNGQNLTVYPLLSPTSARIYTWGNAPGSFMHYHGLILTMDKRLSNRWRADVSYTHATAEGLTTTGKDPNNQVNAIGYLDPADRPNVTKVSTMYDIPRIEVQFVASYMNAGGRPYAAQDPITLPQGRISINIDTPGAYRYPTQNLLSLRATKELFKVGRQRVLLNVALLNALQTIGIQGLVTQNYFSPSFGQGSAWIEPRQMYFQFTIR